MQPSALFSVNLRANRLEIKKSGKNTHFNLQPATIPFFTSWIQLSDTLIKIIKTRILPNLLKKLEKFGPEQEKVLLGSSRT